MNLQPVYPPRGDVRVLCCRCGQWEDSASAWADLDAKPYQAFYCYDCYAFAVDLSQPPQEPATGQENAS